MVLVAGKIVLIWWQGSSTWFRMLEYDRGGDAFEENAESYQQSVGIDLPRQYTVFAYTWLLNSFEGKY